MLRSIVTTGLIPITRRTHQLAISSFLPSHATFSSESEKPLLKSDLASIIAEEHDLPKNKAESILNSVLNTIVETLSKEQAVRLTNFGKFESVYAKERRANNVATGEPMKIPSKQRVKFTPSRVFKERVNKKDE